MKPRNVRTENKIANGSAETTNEIHEHANEIDGPQNIRLKRERRNDIWLKKKRERINNSASGVWTGTFST